MRFKVVILMLVGLFMVNKAIGETERERYYSCLRMVKLLDLCASTPFETSCSSVYAIVYNKLSEKGFNYKFAHTVAQTCKLACEKPLTWTSMRNRVMNDCIYKW